MTEVEKLKEEVDGLRMSIMQLTNQLVDIKKNQITGPMVQKLATDSCELAYSGHKVKLKALLDECQAWYQKIKGEV